MRKKMNQYQAACRIRRYITSRWEETIKDRDGDAPTVFGVAAWRDMGLGGGDGAAIVWEGYYHWTRPEHIVTFQRLIDHTGYTVYPTAEWMIEVC